MIRQLLIMLFLSAHVLAQGVPELNDRSETNLSQVVVHKGTPKVRAEIIQDVEFLIRSLEDLVGLAKEGKAHPIVIELFPAVEGKPGAIRRELFTLPEQNKSFRFQVNIRFSSGQIYERKKLQRVLLELMLVERGLRNLTSDDIPKSIMLPPWIIDGIEEAIAWKAKRGERAVYVALRDHGGRMKVEQVIERERTDDLDPLSRELFRASSGALVMALLAQPQGKQSMNAYLNEASGFEGERMALLREHFPDVNLGREGLEKWWLTQIAAMAESPLVKSMTIPETEKELERALKFHLPDENGLLVEHGIEAWSQVMDLEKEEDRLAATRQASDLLTNLSYRCFATYRPVVGGYLKVVADFSGEKRDHIEEALDNLEMFRKAEKSRHKLLVDLLDWYHLSNVREESGKFEDYLELKKELEKVEVPHNDPMIQYVDQAQKLFERQNKSAAQDATKR